MARSSVLNFFCCALVSRAAATIDIIGYYGNSGNALSSIPTLDQVHPGYNVLILTFASVDSTGEITLEIQGPLRKGPRSTRGRRPCLEADARPVWAHETRTVFDWWGRMDDGQESPPKPSRLGARPSWQA